MSRRSCRSASAISSARAGRFIAEGKVVLRHLIGARDFELESVLVSHNRIDGLLATYPGLAEHRPVYLAPALLMSEIAGFDIHRGVVALGRRKPAQAMRDLFANLPERALVVVLIGISNHDNVGSIFRNAAAFGASAVLLDRTSCDPLYRKAIRVSVGSVFKVPFAVVDDVAALVARLEAERFGILALSPRGTTEIGRWRAPARRALLLGSEGDGLPQALLDRVETARIRMVEDFDSLNVAAASAIALHALSEFGLPPL